MGHSGVVMLEVLHQLWHRRPSVARRSCGGCSCRATVAGEMRELMQRRCFPGWNKSMQRMVREAVVLKPGKNET